MDLMAEMGELQMIEDTGPDTNTIEVDPGIRFTNDFDYGTGNLATSA